MSTSPAADKRRRRPEKRTRSWSNVSTENKPSNTKALDSSLLNLLRETDNPTVRAIKGGNLARRGSHRERGTHGKPCTVMENNWRNKNGHLRRSSDVDTSTSRLPCIVIQKSVDEPPEDEVARETDQLLQRTSSENVGCVVPDEKLQSEEKDVTELHTKPADSVVAICDIKNSMKTDSESLV